MNALLPSIALREAMNPRDPQRPQPPQETPTLATGSDAVSENLRGNANAPPVLNAVESALADPKEPQHAPATPESHESDQGAGQSEAAAPRPSVDTAPSVASTAAPQREAPSENDRPDDTHFIQQPAQDAQVAEERDLEAEVRSVLSAAMDLGGTSPCFGLILSDIVI